MSVYLRGLGIGLAYVAPIGMQNLFVINSAMHQRGSKVLRMALIVIFFDISLSLACFFGIGALLEALPWLRQIILAAGSLVVMWIGAQLIRSEAKLEAVEVELPLWKLVGTAFVVTWANPQALLDGTMLLGAFRATLEGSAVGVFVAGFCSASVLWFSALSVAVSLLSSRFNEKLLTWINRLCGAVIFFYGLRLFWGFLKPLLQTALTEMNIL